MQARSEQNTHLDDASRYGRNAHPLPPSLGTRIFYNLAGCAGCCPKCRPARDVALVRSRECRSALRQRTRSAPPSECLRAATWCRSFRDAPGSSVCWVGCREHFATGNEGLRSEWGRQRKPGWCWHAAASRRPGERRLTLYVAIDGVLYERYQRWSAG